MTDDKGCNNIAEDGNNAIAGSDLKKIMDKALEIFGHSGLAALYFDLEGRSMIFDDEHYYSLDFLEKNLLYSFNVDGTALIMERIRNEMNTVIKRTPLNKINERKEE